MGARYAVVFCMLLVAINAKWIEENVDDIAIKQVIANLETELNKASNSIFYMKIASVSRIRSQTGDDGLKTYKLEVIAGQTSCRKTQHDAAACNVDQLQTCSVKVIPDEAPVLKCSEFVAATTKKPRRGMMGGPMEIEPDDAVRDALLFAMDQYNARTNSALRAVSTDIKKVTSQVVAGVLYRITVEVRLSGCPNTDEHKGHTVLQCPAGDANSLVGECEFAVWSRPWLKEKEDQMILRDHKCPNTAQPIKQVEPAQSNVKKMNIGGDDIDNTRAAFAEFKERYGRQYTTPEEETRRLKIFQENMKIARKLQDTDKGDATYGATMFADLSQEEFKRYVGKPWDLSYDPSMKPARIPDGPIPDNFDWRDHNAVTEVKNQGSCGSCWAFSVTGNIEGQWAVKKSKLVSLSEQELVDCDKLDEGCNGGLPANAYKEIIRLGGLEGETDYPYKGDDEKCHFIKSDVKVYINSSVNISSNEDDMAKWLYHNGPISIGINALAMQFYFGGISHPWSFLCNPVLLDHGVLITGYGIKKGIFSDTPYWSIKNSWGSGWGEKGYYLAYRGAGVCGLNTMASSGIID